MTTNSPPLDSSSYEAFNLLHPGIQQWIYREGWSELRDVQGQSIIQIVHGGKDVLISAPTAAGKTEAAFLPLLSRVLGKDKPGVRVLYIGPLKALINDQFSRLERLCEELEVPVHPWHGDVSASIKQRVRKDPTGVVLITPESLEALFVNHGNLLPKIFANVEGIIIDEIHAFVGCERGAQLQSLLHRLETTVGHKVDRVGLSATLGEIQIAAEFLRPGHGESVQLIESATESAGLRALIVGFYDSRKKPKIDDKTSEETEESAASSAVADHIYKRMRGSNNLVFANARRRVEELGDLLVRKCEANFVPVEFGAHHGSLSKEIRLDAERQLKEDRPFTAICTSTLEMGIDIGSMQSVGQVGVPSSVSSLRQRVGRSGRRNGELPTLWMYAVQTEIDSTSSLMDRLAVGLFQQAAMLELMVDRWCEPPRDTALHLSTLVQQSLSAVAERGGVSPGGLYHLMCKGPFNRIDKDTFVQFLRQMGKAKVLVSGEDGTLLAGEVGERMLSHYSFYSAFNSPEEFRIICDGRTLGTLPVDFPVQADGFIVFAARRWKVLEIDEKARTILVQRSKAGKPPTFGNDGPFGTRREVRQRMQKLYEEDSVPSYLDSTATEIFKLARQEYRVLSLSKKRVLQDGNDTYLFLWDSDYVAVTLSLTLGMQGFAVDGDGLALEIKGASAPDVATAISQLAKSGVLPSAESLAKRVTNKQFEKHDYLLGDELLEKEYIAKSLDMEATKQLLKGDLMAKIAPR